MATTREQQVQRGYNFAIVDEVDSILIDELRTPLIISGPSTVSPISTTSGSRWSISSCQANMLCNRLASEAKELFDAGKVEEGGLRCSKVKLGQPRNKPLLRRWKTGQAQGDRQGRAAGFYRTRRQEELFALKEELFYTTTKSRMNRISPSRDARFSIRMRRTRSSCRI